jgi:lipoate-protein ligase A
MRLLDHSFASPAENLALDEALLDEAEAGRLGQVLRFWESPMHFVVLGLSQAVEDYVFREACTRDGVPILRRCSAGGCVLQGPGCLNYSLILRTDRPGCGSIHASYETIRGSISMALGELGCEAVLAGISDLAIDGGKVSGSAQRRRKNYFLHHGTLLYAMDFGLCSRYLREPAEQPPYRALRQHQAFLRNLPGDRQALNLAVSRVFQCTDVLPITDALVDRVRKLVSEKYADSNWIHRK